MQGSSILAGCLCLLHPSTFSVAQPLDGASDLEHSTTVLLYHQSIESVAEAIITFDQMLGMITVRVVQRVDCPDQWRLDISD